MPLTRVAPVLKWTVAILLVVMAIGGAALLHVGPVRGYFVLCSKSITITCDLQRETSTGVQASRLHLDPGATASVKVATYRRTGPRTFLYLGAGSDAWFVAEFEGSDAEARAQESAARLNLLFANSGPGEVRVESRPPEFMRWLMWGGFGVFLVLAVIVLRALFKPPATSS